MTTPPRSAKSSTQHPTRQNIEAVAKLEREALQQRSRTERLSEDAIKIVGSFVFLVCNLLLIAAWAAVNLNLIPGIRPFDKFPFGELALILATEGIFLTILVLISQNRLMRQADKRAHLDLQVSLLTEQELTAVLQMLQKLCEHAGVPVDYSKHARIFGEDTDLQKLAQELDEKLPSD